MKSDESRAGARAAKSADSQAARMLQDGNGSALVGCRTKCAEDMKATLFKYQSYSPSVTPAVLRLGKIYQFLL